MRRIAISVVAFSSLAGLIGCSGGPSAVAHEDRAILAFDAANPVDNPLDENLAKGFVGQWRNQLRSTLVIKSVDPATGSISGSYRSPSGGGETDFPLVGWVNTQPAPEGKNDHVDVVSFSVRWGQHGSVTTWNGYYQKGNGKSEIVGNWLLSRPNSDFGWDHVLVGQDRFEKQ